MCSCCAYALSLQRAFSLWPSHWRGARVRIVDARLDVVSIVAAAAGRLAVRVRSAGRRCAHGARPDLPDALLAHGSAGKPIGVVRTRTVSCRRPCKSRCGCRNTVCSITRRRTFNPIRSPWCCSRPRRRTGWRRGRSRIRPPRGPVRRRLPRPPADRRSHRRRPRSASDSAG